MSKQITRVLALVLLSGLLVSSLLIHGQAKVSRTQGATAATGTARNAAIVATTAAVLKETSEIRELPILKTVRSGAQSRTEIERMIIKNLDDESTPADMHATELILTKLGLVTPGFKYRPFVIKLLTEQVAGYYDPKAQQFYLADWIELEGQKPVMAHELTHALQDQHFDLRRFEKWPKGDSDAELAAHALIEGDATLAMTLYMARNPLVALAFIRSLGAEGSASEQFKQAPRAIRESLLFPYEEGSEWATQVYRRGGWSMVSQAFTKLPLSSEQILHADKYFSYEAPVKITLPDLKNSLPGWKRLEYDVNGEWGYYLILDQFLNDAAESKRAAAGWAGDRFALYEGPKPDDVFIAQMTAWDTEKDAKEFFDAYARRTEKRYPNLKPAEPVTNKGLGQRLEWQTGEGDVLLELNGSHVLVLEGIPAKADANSLATQCFAAVK
ncbi:MAG TPA: hypothetical protein VKB46_12890 [Pyrinomonadaceae bacterium]|nr:hypothetical protein [Pyrinomonadaceae bacterium]